MIMLLAMITTLVDQIGGIMCRKMYFSKFIKPFHCHSLDQGPLTLPYLIRKSHRIMIGSLASEWSFSSFMEVSIQRIFLTRSRSFIGSLKLWSPCQQESEDHGLKIMKPCIYIVCKYPLLLSVD